MIANPDKFQAIVTKKNCRIEDSYALSITTQTPNSESYENLFGIKIDNTLSFDQHIYNLYKKASS